MDNKVIQKLAMEVDAFLRKQAQGTISRTLPGQQLLDPLSVTDKIFGTDDASKGAGEIQTEANAFFQRGTMTQPWDAAGLSVFNTDNYFIQNKSLYSAGFGGNLGAVFPIDSRVGNLAGTAVYGPAVAGGKNLIKPDLAKSISERGIAYFRNKGDLVQAQVVQMFMLSVGLTPTSLQAAASRSPLESFLKKESRRAR